MVGFSVFNYDLAHGAAAHGQECREVHVIWRIVGRCVRNDELANRCRASSDLPSIRLLCRVPCRRQDHTALYANVRLVPALVGCPLEGRSLRSLSRLL